VTADNGMVVSSQHLASDAASTFFDRAAMPLMLR
jgi:hypothetical protein